MTEDEIKKMIDEYARNKSSRLSTIEKALSDELDAILKEVLSVGSKSAAD